MLAALFLVAALLEGDASARFRCEPASVAVGEPFELVLEVEHPPALAGATLAGGTLTLDPSWVVLASTRARTEAGPGGRARTLRTWRLASLEPGERALADALSAFAFPADVGHIELGDARVSVEGVLAKDEDAPRPLREFPDGFAGSAELRPRARALLWGVLGTLSAVACAAVVLLRRRRRRALAAVPATPLARLGELEGWIETERGREGCYELTRLLRSATDGARGKDRSGLTDEEWLAELSASLWIESGAVAELEHVFARAARVKYAGDAPTPWALKETFARARTALQVVEGWWR